MNHNQLKQKMKNSKIEYIIGDKSFFENLHKATDKVNILAVPRNSFSDLSLGIDEATANQNRLGDGQHTVGDINKVGNIIHIPIKVGVGPHHVINGWNTFYNVQCFTSYAEVTKDSLSNIGLCLTKIDHTFGGMKIGIIDTMFAGTEASYEYIEEMLVKYLPSASSIVIIEVADDIKAPVESVEEENKTNMSPE